jgi:hypothetical protein
VSWNLAVLCVIGVGVASAALNFRETRLAASAAHSTPSNLVAGPVLAPRHPIRLADRA